jgi:hypothetical protein
LNEEQLLKQTCQKLIDQVLSDEMISIITDCYTEVLEDEERFTMSENQLKGLESTCNFVTPLPFEQTAKEILEQ